DFEHGDLIVTQCPFATLGGTQGADCNSEDLDCLRRPNGPRRAASRHANSRPPNQHGLERQVPRASDAASAPKQFQCTESFSCAHSSGTPQDFVAGSKKEAWWKCSEARPHVWKTRIVDRTVRGI